MVYSSFDSKNIAFDNKLEKLFNFKKNGKYIELGANDGITQSNTKLLEEKYNWSGILIEPSNVAFNKLRQNRPNNILVNACMVSSDFTEKTIKGDFNSGSLMASVNGTRLKSNEICEVPCTTLSNVIEKTNITKFDLMSIDTEGYELNVLKGLDLNIDRNRPTYFLIEIYKHMFSEICDYLKNNGYILIENFSNYNIIDNPYWDQHHNDYLFVDNNLQRPIPIYICHYKKLTDRKRYLLDYFIKNNILSSVKWFDSIDRDSINQNDLSKYKYDPEKWIKCNKMWSNELSPPRKLTLPEIAITLTHISIYKYMIDNNIPIALILEDDCIFLDNFKEKLNNVLNKLPLDFDTCFISNSFGWNVSNYKTGYFGLQNNNIYSPEKLIYKMPCGRTADAYLISLSGANKIYNKILPFCLPIDFEHNHLFITEGINNFWAEPAITNPGSEFVYKSANRSIEKNYVIEDVIEDIQLSKIIEYSRIQGEQESTLYFNLESYSKDRINELIERINTNNNFITFKNGDGEIRNMIATNEKDHNCDGCFYYKELGLDLIRSYIFCLKNKNAYIHRWHSHVYNIINRIDRDYSSYYNPQQKFVFFDLLTHKLRPKTPETEQYSIDGFSFKEEQIRFFRTIKKSSRVKIYVSNEDMIKAVAPLLNINFGIVVPETNCYLNKSEILNLIRNQLKDKKDSIVMFSCGMAAKVFITEIFKENSNHTFIDVGSTLDGLIKHSRDFNGTKLYRDVLLKCYLE